MPNDFLQQFMAGWQMGQGRNENQRRNQEMAMEQQRQAQMAQQRAEEMVLRQQEFAVRKKALAAEEAAHKLDAAKQAYDMKSRAASLQGLPAPTAADVGVPQQGPDMAGPPVSQINVPQPSQEMPNPVEGQAPIQMPVLTGPQQQQMAQAEQQRKMRDALGMKFAEAQATAQAQEPFKISADQRNAEAQARREAAATARTEAAAIRAEERAAAKEAAIKAKEGDFGIAKSEGERKAVSMSQYALGKMPEWQDWVKKNEDVFGPVGGRITQLQQTGIARAIGLKPSPTVAKKQAQFAIMRNNMINALSGAAVSPQEYERLKQQVPELTDPPEVIAGKLTELDGYFRENLGRFQAKIPNSPSTPSADPLGIR